MKKNHQEVLITSSFFYCLQIIISIRIKNEIKIPRTFN